MRDRNSTLQICRPRSNLAVALLTVLTLAAAADGPGYRSVSVDVGGRLHIVTGSGTKILAPKLKWQVRFDDSAISPDRQTVGWLAMYPYPEPPGATYHREPIPGALVLYRAGRIIHTFQTEQVFWDWQFQDEGKRVAYSTGPTHGGAAECVLRDVVSGRVVSRWRVKEGSEPPTWAQTLRI